jgi:aryl-alcohol dehydrogenase-like predicted oxidoreductase
MQTRRLGRSGLVVGEIGAGTLGIAAWKGVDPGDARRALTHAVASGADVIDVMADRDLEQLAGAVIREVGARDRAVVVARVAPTGDEWPGRGDRLDRVLPVGWVQDSVERSLRATRLEVLPVCLLGVWYDTWTDAHAWPELRGTMERLIREGKVLHWGVTAAGSGPDDIVRLVADPVIEVVEVTHNLFDRRAEKVVLPAAREHETGVIACAALDQGALGGELGATTRFLPGDPRLLLFTPERLAETAVRVARLAEHVAELPPAARSTDAAHEALELAVARRKGTAVEARSVAELALRFALSAAEVGAVVVGMRSRDHVGADLAAGDGRVLSASLLARLAEHAWDRAG